MITRLLLCVVVLGLALTGCGALRGERVESGMSAPDVQDAQPTAGVGPRPDAIEVRNVADSEAFTFASTELATGRTLLGQDLVGSGPVVLSFLVPQCAACIAAGPDLAVTAAEHPDITFVLIHSGGTTESYETFIERSGFKPSASAHDNVIHLDDSPGLLWARFGVIQQPTNVFIAADGSVTQSLGALDGDQLTTVSRGLIGADALS